LLFVQVLPHDIVGVAVTSPAVCWFSVEVGTAALREPRMARHA
jgi:hypothetical protein